MEKKSGSRSTRRPSAFILKKQRSTGVEGKKIEDSHIPHFMGISFEQKKGHISISGYHFDIHILIHQTPDMGMGDTHTHI